MDHPIAIRRAGHADAPRLSQLAAATFRETFEDGNNADDMARYIAEAFTAEQQAAEIEDPSGDVLLAEVPGPSDGDATAELAGYAHVVAGPAPGAVQGPSPVELKRLYVSRAWHGRGVAQALMDAALDAARARGARTVWLGVWEKNPRAVAFYRKCGFERVGEHNFVLGSDVQTDWVFARPLGDHLPGR